MSITFNVNAHFIFLGEWSDNSNQAAQRLKDLGIEIYAIGVGPDVNRRELEQIVSNPKDAHVFLTAFEDAPTVAGPLSLSLSKGKEWSLH